MSIKYVCNLFTLNPRFSFHSLSPSHDLTFTNFNLGMNSYIVLYIKVLGLLGMDWV